MNHKNKKKLIFFFSVALFLFGAGVLKIRAATSFVYTPMENIPGFEKTSNFFSYVSNVYKFGIWTIGIAAMLMIMIGGYVYLTSAGNTAQTEKAKNIITDAFIGLILALVSWLLLYTINPDLVSFSSLKSAIDNAARSYNGEYPTINSPLPANCNATEWQNLFKTVSASSGIDKCILQALTAIESSCNQVPNRTNGGRDCSAVQIDAQDQCGADCAILEASPEKALACAAKYLKKCDSSVRNTPEEQKIRDIYAGYNGGCGALQPSVSCAGKTNSFGNSFYKWDCPIDCGGYCPVPARTSVFLNYYNECKGN